MILTPGGLVFDIGAHHGETAARLLDELGAGHVVCVEPCLENYLLLRERWKGDGRVTAIHAGVLAAPGFAKISRAAQQDGLSTMVPDRWSSLYPDAGYEEPELVPVITLKMLMAKFGRPDYCKIDVEGCEEQVIQGFFEAQQRPHVITFEFHGTRAQDAINCIYMLRELGYEKALVDEQEPLLITVPTESIHDVLDRFRAAPPTWGNFTVM